MGGGKRQEAIRAMRGQIWSPGRPSIALREDRVRFWLAIAAGASSEDAEIARRIGRSASTISRELRRDTGMTRG